MINYVNGDATDPVVKEGTRIIVHCCNDVGAWGKGFVNALSEKFPRSEAMYREWFRCYKDDKIDLMDEPQFPPWKLGSVQFVDVDNNIIVANMIGQHRILLSHPKLPPIRYDAIKKGLVDVLEFAFEKGDASIHMPFIGCGLAGGRWKTIESIVEEVFEDSDIQVYVYRFEDKNSISYIPVKE